MTSPTGNPGVDLLRGLAVLLREAGVAAWALDGGEPYTSSTRWPIYLGPDVPPTPSELVVLTLGVRERVRATTTQAVQLRFRGGEDADPNEVAAKAAEADRVFYPNGFPLSSVILSTGIRLGAILPGSSSSPLGRDDRRRPEYALNVRARFRG